jgi:hypothetical protein
MCGFPRAEAVRRLVVRRYVSERVAELIGQARADAGRPAGPDLDGSADVLVTLLIGYVQRVAVAEPTSSEALLHAIQTTAVPAP